jgi:hypothetical protein
METDQSRFPKEIPMHTLDLRLWNQHDYRFCMEERRQMLQRYAAIPKDAREEHWVAGNIPANTFAKSAAVAWLKHSIGRLRAAKQGLPLKHA